ncbi:MAG: FecCD family ABC transporter permease [Desulfurococcaceae archaeon]
MIANWRNILLAFSAPVAFFLLVYGFTVYTSAGVSELVAEYRIYRAVYSMLAGAVLAASGCFLQSSLRNPLVDHYVLGIGSGALFSTYLAALLWGYSLAVAPLSAAVGGLAALALTVLLAEKMSGSDVAYVLAGISVTTLFSGLSLFTYYYLASKQPFAASLLLAGSFALSRPQQLPYVLASLALAAAGYVLLSKKLNALALGDEHASQLGVDPRLARLASSTIAGVASSVLVSLFGLVGFIGLVSPHVARFVLKTGDNRLVVPTAMFFGMAFLYSADAFSRYVAAPLWGEVPAGSIVSLIGAPFFAALLVSRFSRRLA